MQRSHTVSDYEFPGLSCHKIGINLGHPLSIVERIDGWIYEGHLSQGQINVLLAGLSSHWRWKELGEADVVHYLPPDLVRERAIDLGKPNLDRIPHLSLWKKETELKLVKSLFQEPFSSHTPLLPLIASYDH